MKINFIAKISLVAALYVTLSLALSPLSFGMFQIRIAGVLILLLFYNRKYSAAVILGCAITNLFSPLGLVDLFFGTLATAVSCYFISKLKIKNAYPDNLRFSNRNGGQLNATLCSQRSACPIVHQHSGQQCYNRNSRNSNLFIN